MPYQVFGGQKLYEKKEVKDLSAYLMCIKNKKDELSLRRILNVPPRGIGLKTLEKLLREARIRELSLLEILPDLATTNLEIGEKIRHSISDLEKILKDMRNIFYRDHKSLREGLEILIERVDFYGYIEKNYHDNPKQIQRRKNDVERFLLSAERFQKYFKEGATLERFIERLILSDNQDQSNSGEGEEDPDVRKNQVSLMTLHSAKGLEFPIVYLIGVEEEILPHKKTIEEGTIDEERRLFYVGITRAREKLVMSYSKERELYGKKVKRFPSRFLAEAKAYYQFQDRTRFDHLSVEEEKEYKSNFFSKLIQSL